MKASNFRSRIVFFPASRLSLLFSVMSRSSVCALLLLSLAALAPAHAQTAAAIAPDKPLGLDEAIALAVQKNFDLQTQTLTLEQQKEALIIAESALLLTSNDDSAPCTTASRRYSSRVTTTRHPVRRRVGATPQADSSGGCNIV